ncbi:hypothetical protein EVAR_6742_1 [Eumeta japonica]|uniref:Uncharacterized protein n=1 Tax=Eumeta variegata TaxID=151549 RepID=A0A4C1V5V1_EUMVA|nr:hypothetical protein EVAR_6742_1 [Eumeta japonica]
MHRGVGVGVMPGALSRPTLPAAIRPLIEVDTSAMNGWRASSAPPQRLFAVAASTRNRINGYRRRDCRPTPAPLDEALIG